MSLTLLEIIALTGIFTLAGTVKGAIGLGLPTVSMGLLSLMMPPGQAAALLLLPSLITNLWQLLRGARLGALCRRLWPMMLCVTLGTLLSAGALTAGDGHLAPLALGVCLIGYALLGFTRFDWRVSAAAEPWLGPLCGLVTGALTGATGVFVIPAVPYLNALGLARDDLVQALGAVVHRLDAGAGRRFSLASGAARHAARRFAVGAVAGVGWHVAGGEGASSLSPAAVPPPLLYWIINLGR